MSVGGDSVADVSIDEPDPARARPGPAVFSPISTRRLTVRAPTLDDAADLAERRSDPGTAAYQAWAIPYSLAKAEELIADQTSREMLTPGHWTQLIVVRNSDGRIVGDLATQLSQNARTAEVGYTFHSWARGQGFATEAAAALCDHLVRVVGVHRLEAHTHPDNAASIAVLMRLGFEAEGIRRESYWVDDVVTDDAMFGLLARDWDAGRVGLARP
jgi:aminoglycoside 6'-N-acetyltransferase